MASIAAALRLRDFRVPNFEEAAVEAALRLLSEYLRIDTSNPPGDESAAVEFLEKQFAQAGFVEERSLAGGRPAERSPAYVRYNTGPGRFALAARIPGSDPSLDDLVLSHHMDVVPADPTEWEHPPFAGEIADGFVWGRGALDMKGMGVQLLVAFLAAHANKVPLTRGVTILALPDEENTGIHGAKVFAERYLQELKPWAILTEGGFGLRDMMVPGVTFPIDVAEKSSLRFVLRCRGRAGHSNQPARGSAVEKLVACLAAVDRDRYPMRLHPVVAETLRRLAGRKSFPESFLLAHASAPLVRRVLDAEFRKDRTLNAMTRNTVTVTVLRAGEAPNAVPSSAEATIDVRLLPDEDPAAVLAGIRRRLSEIDPNHEVDVLSDTPPQGVSDWNHELFRGLEDVLRAELPGALVAPIMDVGGTDMKHFRHRGVPAFGLVPIVIDPEDLKLVHSANERLSIENFRLGLRIVYKLIVSLCTQAAVSPGERSTEA